MWRLHDFHLQQYLSSSIYFSWQNMTTKCILKVMTKTSCSTSDILEKHCQQKLKQVKQKKTLTSVIICGLKNKKKNQEDGQIQQTKTFTSVWYSWVNLLKQQVNTQSLRGWLKEVETEKKIGLWGRLWAYNQLCVRLRVCHASRCQFPLPTLQNLKPPHSGLECAVC